MVVQPQDVEVHGTLLKYGNIDFQTLPCPENCLLRLDILVRPVHFRTYSKCLAIYLALPKAH